MIQTIQSDYCTCERCPCCGKLRRPVSNNYPAINTPFTTPNTGTPYYKTPETTCGGT